MALNCRTQPHNVFARKNYTYPDLPKGYQISQYELPLSTDGSVQIDSEESAKEIGIVRVHLEEDTGKLVHQDAASLVDFNRAGVPLMEIVSDSSIRSAAESDAYLVKIRQLVRYLEASSGDMEKGAMRCEANISVRPAGSTELGTKVEVKNLNSFRAVRNAITYEVERQIQILEDGGQVRQVTMGWNEEAGITQEQRSKETSEDYRYFPEPDLLDVDLSQEWIDRVRDRLPELPDAKRARFATEYGLNDQDIGLLVEDRSIADYFERATRQGGADPKLVSNWMTGQIFRRLKEDEVAIEDIKVEPEALVELIGLVDQGTINQNAARDVLKILWEEVSAVIADNPDAVEKIKDGNDRPIKFLMGQVMKASRGKANPQMVEELLKKQIDD